MRKCPKCNAVFDDNDIRSMCGTCLVSLVTVQGESPASSPYTSGPVSVGSADAPPPLIAPTIRLTPPEMTIPEMPTSPVPELPQIPLPEPPMTPVPEVPLPQEPGEPMPGPIPAPVTPQPEPGMPQPPLVPVPQPEPVPQRVPTPAPRPQPTPAPRPLPQPQPRRAPQPTPQPAPRPTPSPQPTEPAAGTAPGKRRLTQDEIASGRSTSAALGFIGAVAGLIAVGILLAMLGSPGSFNFGTFIFLAITTTAAVYFIRQAIYQSAIQQVKLVVPQQPRLGGMLPIEVEVGCLRDIPVTEAQLTITAEERAVSGSGKSESVSRNLLFSRSVPLCPPGTWQGSHAHRFTAHVEIPADAIPSFSAQKNHVDWHATLWVGIPGWYPDIRQRQPLVIPPVRAQRVPLPPTANQRFILPNLGPLNATIAFDCALARGNVPIFQAGKRIPFTVTIAPTVDGPRQHVLVELFYHISGSGDNEHVNVARVQCFSQGWTAGTQREQQGVLQLPMNAPISFDGKHVRVHWSLIVRHEVPWQFSKQQAFEIQIVPTADD